MRNHTSVGWTLSTLTWLRGEIGTADPAIGRIIPCRFGGARASVVATTDSVCTVREKSPADCDAFVSEITTGAGPVAVCILPVRYSRTALPPCGISNLSPDRRRMPIVAAAGA